VQLPFVGERRPCERAFGCWQWHCIIGVVGVGGYSKPSQPTKLPPSFAPLDETKNRNARRKKRKKTEEERVYRIATHT
jgi:hypothetical protein